MTNAEHLALYVFALPDHAFDQLDHGMDLGYHASVLWPDITSKAEKRSLPLWDPVKLGAKLGVTTGRAVDLIYNRMTKEEVVDALRGILSNSGVVGS